MTHLVKGHSPPSPERRFAMEGYIVKCLSSSAATMEKFAGVGRVNWSDIWIGQTLLHSKTLPQITPTTLTMVCSSRMSRERFYSGRFHCKTCLCWFCYYKQSQQWGETVHIILVPGQIEVFSLTDNLDSSLLKRSTVQTCLGTDLSLSALL